MKIGQPSKDYVTQFCEVLVGEVFSSKPFSSYFMKIPDAKVEVCANPVNAVNLNTGHLMIFKPDTPVTEIKDAYLAFGGDK